MGRIPEQTILGPAVVSGNGIIPWYKVANIEPGMFDAHTGYIKGQMDWKVQLEPSGANLNLKGKRIWVPTGDGLSIDLKTGKRVVGEPTKFQVMRVDPKRGIYRCLGEVTDNYKPFQNKHLFELAELMAKVPRSIKAKLKRGAAMFETCGVMEGGAVVWILFKLPSKLTVAGDAINQYFLITNFHTGKAALKMMFTPVRVVCENTLKLALNLADRQYEIRHIGNNMTMEEMAKAAAECLGFANDYFDGFEKVANELLHIKLTPPTIAKYVEDIAYPLPKKPSIKMLGTVRNNRERLRKLIVVPNLQNVQGTGWALYNAVADDQDHYKTLKAESDERRMEILFKRTWDETDQHGPIRVKDECLAFIREHAAK